MAKLSPSQIESVSAWAAAGSNLNDIQGRLKTEFGLVLTYLDTRMLLIDSGIHLPEKPKPPPEPPPPAAPAPAPAADLAAAPQGEPPAADAKGGKVQVTVDTVSIPGTLASGKVLFSDGKTAAWYVDQMGRLGMRAPDPGYKPPPSDIPEFEMQLDRVLQSLGA